MTYFPDVRDENSDRFEAAIFEAVKSAELHEIEEAVLRACEYIEGLRAQDPVRTRVNNATSTIMRSVRRLRARAGEAEAKLSAMEAKK